MALYVAILAAVDWLRLPVRKDEVHFWPTALTFSQSWVPSFEQLRSYRELNTPLPFVLFGLLEHLFHGGIAVARAADLLLSLLALVSIQFAAGSVSRRSLLCSVGVLLCPYFVATGTHLYTEMLTIALLLGGMSTALRGRHGLSALLFLLAISCRQYAVAFPLALLLWRVSEARSTGRLPSPTAAWLGPLLAMAGLAGWFLFFGGPASRVAIESQFVATLGVAQVLPQNVGYFLACVGLYYVVPETLFFSESRAALWTSARRRRAVGVALALAGVVLFAVWPPLRNPVGYPFPELGYFDKALRLGLSDTVRVAVLAAFAILAAVRFCRVELASVLTFANALLMLKAHIAWDKYALPLLVILWWLRAQPATEPQA